MARMERTFHVEAAPDVVWDVIRDVERWPEWTPSIRSLELIGGGQLGPDASAKIGLRGAGTSVWRVTAYDPAARQFVWEASVLPGVRVSGGHRAEADSDGTRATLWTETLGPLSTVLGLVLMRMGARNVRDEEAGLKARSESMARSEAYRI